APPSTVRNTVDPAPLAHATLSLTALTPRSRTLTPLVCTVQCGATNSVNPIKIARPFIILNGPGLVRALCSGQPMLGRYRRRRAFRLNQQCFQWHPVPVLRQQRIGIDFHTDGICRESFAMHKV